MYLGLTPLTKTLLLAKYTLPLLTTEDYFSIKCLLCVELILDDFEKVKIKGAETITYHRATTMNLMSKYVSALFLSLIFSGNLAFGESLPEYYFSNSWLKDDVVLTVDDQMRLKMAPKSRDNPRQRWNIVAAHDGYVRIYNRAFGTKLAMDSSKDKRTPKMAGAGDYSGQYWAFTQHGEWFRISSQYSGTGKVLDTLNSENNHLFFKDANIKQSGSFWKQTLAPNYTSMITIDAAALETREPPSLPNSIPNSCGGKKCEQIEVRGLPRHLATPSGPSYSAAESGTDCSATHGSMPARDRSGHVPERFVLDGLDCRTTQGVVTYQAIHRWFKDLANAHYPASVGSYPITKMLYELDRQLQLPESSLQRHQKIMLIWLLAAINSLEANITTQAHNEFIRWQADPCNYYDPHKNEFFGVNTTNFTNDDICLRNNDGGYTQRSVGLLEGVFGNTGAGVQWATPLVSQFKQVAVNRMSLTTDYQLVPRRYRVLSEQTIIIGYQIAQRHGYLVAQTTRVGSAGIKLKHKLVASMPYGGGSGDTLRPASSTRPPNDRLKQQYDALLARPEGEALLLAVFALSLDSMFIRN